MENNKENILESIVDQIKLDLLNGNYEAIDKILLLIPYDNLLEYLPAREQRKYL